MGICGTIMVAWKDFNYMERKTILITVFILALLGSIVLNVHLLTQGRITPPEEIKRDTVNYVDTSYYRVPVPFDSAIVRYDTLRTSIISYRDSIIMRDSVIQVPITQKVYQDSTYKAYVSGWHPNLDSIFVYNRRTVITNTITQQKVRKFGIGLNVGFGYGTVNKRMEPYIGIGATYIIW